jgi:D-lactate dehydrogenase
MYYAKAACDHPGKGGLMTHLDPDHRYWNFLRLIQSGIPQCRIISDPLGTLAYGTDASFYRLIPKVVVKAEDESEVVCVLKAAGRLGLPVTFRAAGTSLSGQAVSDSILLIAGTSWKAHSILDDGARIRLQPGVIGAQANRLLAPYGRKIGPDPASINAAMIGGIAANNASGMCCGTAQNSYQTLDSMRIVFADGNLLDTGDPASRLSFEKSHAHVIEQISRLAAAVSADQALTDRIRNKFKIKNTTGYSINALVDFSDPFDIIQHLMVGSEGTLGFISEIVYRTVVEHPHKASALMIFPTIENACRAVFALRRAPVQAVELMDRAALRSVENKKGLPGYLKELPDEATALLVETRASTAEALRRHVAAVLQVLDAVPPGPTAASRGTGGDSGFPPAPCAATLRPIRFTDAAEEYTRLWDIRKGLFPAVGAIRPVGTTVIIEDVAFPLVHLAAATLELQQLFQRYHYDEAIIFGHALEGNLHFVFTQDFSKPEEIERYRRFMDDVCRMVVERYDGSLKAEHGTGRNMAPYVEMEWGAAAYALIRQIKKIFDPGNLLNPGVILSDDGQTHIRNLKPLPPVHEILDKCTECGFCEAVCPSRNLSLTPRQRIAVQREIARLKATCENPGRLQALERDYVYLGEQTCAADGLCAVNCPVDINTGDHTKHLRSLQAAPAQKQRAARWVAVHYHLAAGVLRAGLHLAHWTHRGIGTRSMQKLSGLARTLSGRRLPAWNPYMPQTVPRPRPRSSDPKKTRKVVYFPSCINLVMGPAAGDPDQTPLHQVIVMVLERAGFGVILPPTGRLYCCGTPFESKGYGRQAAFKSDELNRLLLAASQHGRYPVLCDTGPCTYRMRQTLDARLKIFEPMEFIQDFLLDNLKVAPSRHPVAVHITCSSRKMGLEGVFRQVSGHLAPAAVFPDEISCCGWAGDRGFNFPELTAAALAPLKASLAGRCIAGYTNSRTCEIGLSLHSGIYYKSIFYLLEQCSRQR